LELHTAGVVLQQIDAPVYNRIAVALDFSQNDNKLIAHAVGQGHEHTNYVLIHVVESAATRVIGNDADDLETRKDQQHIDTYVQQLKEKGVESVGLLGFNDRSKEIIRIVKQTNADMLVIGAHGHSGVKDLLYGETVDSVRHGLKIPVLVVNL
jgi:manganese transport protein